MMRFSIVIFILSCLGAHGQTSYSGSALGKNEFVFVSSGTDTSSLTYIKTLQCTGKRGEDISMPYKIIRKEAIQAGANCFKLRGFKYNAENKTITLILAVYAADEWQCKIIVNNQPANQVFLFSDDKFNNKKTTFQVNGEHIAILSGYYYQLEMKPGEELKINKGGFSGESVKLRWNENGSSRFFTIGGFHMMNAPMTPSGPPSVFGVYSSTGSITEIDYNLGFLLSEVLTRQTESLPE